MVSTDIRRARERGLVSGGHGPPTRGTASAWEQRLEETGKLLLRVVVGGLMLLHEADKMVKGLDVSGHRPKSSSSMNTVGT